MVVEDVDEMLPEIDPQHPNAARIYDYLLGGRHNFAADRQAGDAVIEAMPDVRQGLWASRDFLRRAVTHVAVSGIDQFLDLGAGIPLGDHVHEIARRDRPGSRVVYVDVDAGAVVHWRAIVGDDPGAGALYADIAEPDAVLGSRAFASLIDPGRPVCLLAVSVAHYIPDAEVICRALDRYREYAAPGSCLVVSHATANAGEERTAQRVRQIYNTTTSPFTLRDAGEVRALFGDWDLLDPGVVTASLWHPDAATLRPSAIGRQGLVGVARKRQP